jgi:hypothetical protein
VHEQVLAEAAAAAAAAGGGGEAGRSLTVALPFVDDLPPVRTVLAGAPLPTLAAGHVLELVGGAGAGKTEVLCHLAARAAASGRAVVWVDADLKLCATRLARALQSVGVDAAARVHVFRCSDSLQLAATLHSLAFRTDVPVGAPPRVLVLDGVASLYWQDRADGVSGDAQAFYQRQVVSAVRRLQRSTPTAVVATRAALLGPPGGRPDLPPRDVMCAAWSGLVTHRLWLHQHAPAHYLARALPVPPRGGAAWPYTIDDSGVHCTGAAPAATSSSAGCRCCVAARPSRRRRAQTLPHRRRHGRVRARRHAVGRRHHYRWSPAPHLPLPPVCLCVCACGCGTYGGRCPQWRRSRLRAGLRPAVVPLVRLPCAARRPGRTGTAASCTRGMHSSSCSPQCPGSAARPARRCLSRQLRCAHTARSAGPIPAH